MKISPKHRKLVFILLLTVLFVSIAGAFACRASGIESAALSAYETSSSPACKRGSETAAYVLGSSNSHAKSTPVATATPGIPTIEQEIETALNSRTSFWFQIADDHVFTGNLDGYMTYKRDGKMSSSPQTAEWVMNELKEFSQGIVIRIDDGVASMQDSAKYTCAMSVLPNGGGVSLAIYSVKSSSLSESIVGVISGNTFTASQVHSFATYSSYTKSGRGYVFSGDYQVSLIEILPEAVQPESVTAHYQRHDDYSVTISWTDPNPAGTIAYYEIYRVVGIGTDFTVVATVSNGSSWTDNSKEAKDSYWSVLNYYVVAYNKAGIASEDSNLLVF